jgi:hypothetical protein
MPGCSQLLQYEQQRGHHFRPSHSSAKKVVKHCKFSEKFGFWRNIMYQIDDATENAWFLSNLIKSTATLGWLLGIFFLQLGD